MERFLRFRHLLPFQFSSGLRTSDSGLRTSDSQAQNHRAAFTLIELLVVVAVMGVLLALLGGGIRKSLDNAKKKGRETEVASLAAAIENYHTDTGKYPITIKSGQYTYTYKENNDEVFTYLLNPSKNALGKRYLDMNGLRTAKNGRVKRLESDSEPLADYTGAYYKVTFDLKTKSVKVE